MESSELSRRSLLQAIATVIATAATPLRWPDVAQAMEQARAVGHAGAGAKISFLTTAEAADIEAVAAQIIPTDDSPGAREAGVVHFIDRALGTFFSQLASDYRAQLATFQAGYRERYPAARSFASLTSAEQIEFLKGIDQTPFFSTTHLLTMLGMFTLPEYGGNRDAVGWKLIGFEDAHAFYPPFGYYDRDYPGFVIDEVKGK
jgi:Gluconate 2-dehydrogenase subunit 3